jgi:hypothetical protein
MHFRALDRNAPRWWVYNSAQGMTIVDHLSTIKLSNTWKMMAPYPVCLYLDPNNL